MHAAGDSLPRPETVLLLRSLAARLWSGLAVPAIAVSLTLVQVLLVCGLTLQPDPVKAYARLAQWDSGWYAWIAEHGYVEARPGVPEGQWPVGFFPGFPLAGRLVSALTGWPAETNVVVAAQLACVGFWTYLLLLLRRSGASPGLTAFMVAAVLVHPCAFYLVVGYSESLFLTGLLGLAYWSGVGGWRGWSLAVIHGVLMTSTRIVGLPLVVLPLLVVLGARGTSEGSDGRPCWRCGLLTGVLASLGGLLFFAYSYLTFGQWDLYLTVQKSGWGVRPDYLALFRPEVYRLDVPLFAQGQFNPNALSRLCVPFTLLAAVCLLLLELTKGTHHFFARLPYYAAAGLMFFVALSGLANSGLVSMIRYTFCVHVMLCLAAAHLVAHRPAPAGTRRIVAVAAAGLALLVSLAFEIVLIVFYTRGHWVS